MVTDQEVRTYYEEAKKQKEAEKRHADRRELNRKLREKQEPKIEKVKRAAQSVRDVISPSAQKIGGFLKERSAAIAHESRDIRPRRQNYGGSVIGGGDPFGMGQLGNPFAPPRQEPEYRRPHRKKPKNRKAAPVRRRPLVRSGKMMGGIPKELRWMF